MLQDEERKVLGINWNISSDQIVFSLDEPAEQARRLEPTKGNVISLIGKFLRPFWNACANSGEVQCVHAELVQDQDRLGRADT